MAILRIPLTKGKFALIDEADADLVSGYVWRVSEERYGDYAVASHRFPNGRWTIVSMHRIVLAAPTGSKVDHINHDGLDNRRENLRLCSQAENMRNRRGPNANTTTGYLGVCWDRARQRYLASVQADGKHHYVGRFATADEAARARDRAAIELHGEFARLNFPKEEP